MVNVHELSNDEQPHGGKGSRQSLIKDVLEFDNPHAVTPWLKYCANPNAIYARLVPSMTTQRRSLSAHDIRCHSHGYESEEMYMTVIE